MSLRRASFLLALVLGSLAPSTALAQPGDVGTSGPLFGNPTLLTNPWAAFEVDSVKVLRGRIRGKRVTEVVRHLDELRLFPWAGGEVACRVVEERDFRDGRLEEVARTYLAQADDGDVWMFGEVSIVYADGVAVEIEDDSWLVGGSVPGDPPGVIDADQPALFMPREPVAGTEIVREPFGASPETLTVLKLGKAKVPAGSFAPVIKLREDDGEDGGKSQFVWVARGVGVIKTRGKRERTQLVASSLIDG